MHRVHLLAYAQVGAFLSSQLRTFLPYMDLELDKKNKTIRKIISQQLVSCKTIVLPLLQ